MIKRTVTIGGHTIPKWAKCYCVSVHRPSYAHPLPYEMPGGDFLYLCPATHHSLMVFLKFCDELGGPPAQTEGYRSEFSHMVMKLGKLIWTVNNTDLTQDQYMRMETYKMMSRRLDNG